VGKQLRIPARVQRMMLDRLGHVRTTASIAGKLDSLVKQQK
jgi:hypothetical protein